MSDQAALLAAIRANPDDDTPRLIYADWLDEHLPDRAPSPADGPSARAEFIRVQCRLAQRPYDDPDYPMLLEREEELGRWLAAHEGDAAAPDLPADLEWFGDSFRSDEPTCRRGFPEEAEYTDYDEEPEKNVARITAALAGAFATSTVRTLRLEDVYGAEVAGLAADPVAAGLRGLVLDYIADDDETTATRGLADSKYLTNLRRLHLEFTVAPADLQALAKGRNLNALESFALDQTAPAGLKALGAARWFRDLRELRLWLNNRDTFKALGELPAMPHLAALAVLGHAAPAAGAFKRFAANGTFPRLGYLELAHVELTPDLLAALARAPWPLRHLKLHEVEVRKAGAEALANAAFADSLRVLELSDCQITVGGVQALAAAPNLAGLKHLDLTDNPIGPGGLAALARSRHLRGLRALDLHGCGFAKAPIDTAAMLHFLSALDMPELRHLTLDGLPVGVRGAKVLAAGGTFARLTKLDLSHCGLRETGAKALVESKSLGNLVSLDLSGNNAGKGAVKLASPKVFPRLGDCDLESNRLPKAALARLRKRPGVRV